MTPSNQILPEALVRKISRLSLSDVKESYDRQARFYDFLYGLVLHPGRCKLSERLGIAAADARILEMGVGTGLMLPLYPKEAQVLGVDVSPIMIERAGRRIAEQDLDNIRLELLDAESNGLPDAAFDHVVLAYVYSVSPDPQALVDEAFRVCKDGGDVWILNHFSGKGHLNLLEWLMKPFTRWIGYRSDFAYEEWVESQDWQIVSEDRVNLFGVSRLLQIRKPETVTKPE